MRDIKKFSGICAQSNIFLKFSRVFNNFFELARYRKFFLIRIRLKFSWNSHAVKIFMKSALGQNFL
jgi:hypothetical protein